MTKRQLIDQIMTVNRSARPGFLARFDDDALGDYLDHLLAAQQPRLIEQTNRYERYFRAPAATAVLETPEERPPGDEDESPDEDGLWSTDKVGETDEAPAQSEATLPPTAFIYDRQHAPSVSARQTHQDDEEQQIGDQDDETVVADEIEHDDMLDEETVGVAEYADSSFDETDEDMETWLF